jgi:hypothetical protein
MQFPGVPTITRPSGRSPPLKSSDKRHETHETKSTPNTTVGWTCVNLSSTLQCEIRRRTRPNRSDGGGGEKCDGVFDAVARVGSDPVTRLDSDGEEGGCAGGGVGVERERWEHLMPP